MWTPVSGEDLAKQLGQLSRLYLALLESVLIHTMGEEQNVQTGRLDTVLAQKLNLLLDKSLEDLERFLEQNGQTKGLGAIKAALYKRTAGKTISPQIFDFFSPGTLCSLERRPEGFSSFSRQSCLELGPSVPCRLI